MDHKRAIRGDMVPAVHDSITAFFVDIIAAITAVEEPKDRNFIRIKGLPHVVLIGLDESVAVGSHAFSPAISATEAAIARPINETGKASFAHPATHGDRANVKTHLDQTAAKHGDVAGAIVDKANARIDRAAAACYTPTGGNVVTVSIPCCVTTVAPTIVAIPTVTKNGEAGGISAILTALDNTRRDQETTAIRHARSRYGVHTTRVRQLTAVVIVPGTSKIVVSMDVFC